MKVAFLGQAGTGKTTACNYIFLQLSKMGHPAQIVKFASPLYETHDFYNKVVNTTRKNRRFLQDLSDVVKKHYGYNIFIKTLLSQVSQMENAMNILCDDARYYEEVIALKENGFIIVYITADNGVRKLRHAMQGIEFNDNHPSEQNIEKTAYLADYYFDNSCDPQDLYEFLDLVIFENINIGRD